MASAGFTLIELIAVIGIIALLSSLVFGAVRGVQEATRRSKCASNLRQMATAAIAYADDNKGEFPWAMRKVSGYDSWCWDFIVPKGGKAEPGVMWDGYGLNQVLQCPSYINGKANWDKNPFTGYNYNSSFVGKVENDFAERTRPSRISHIKAPHQTALFGDGHYAAGANKFMRSPQSDEEWFFDASSDSVRAAGTQGYRHGGKTNIAFADGHVEAISKIYTIEGKPGHTANAPGRIKCGFISEDNRLYDLN